MSDTYIARPDLLNQLFNPISSPTTQGVVLVGPAGSGKTVALRQFAEAGRERNVWVIFVAVREIRGEGWLEWHVVQQVLLEQLSFWAEGTAPSELEGLRSLGEQIRSSLGRQSEGLLGTFLDRMSTLLRAGVQVVIVIDGIDEAYDSEATFRQLESLLRRKPSAFKVLVSSRQVASLTQFALRELLFTIEMPSLTPAEVEAIFSRYIVESDLDPMLLEKAISYSQGNPLVAMLLAQQIKTGGVLPTSPSLAELPSQLYRRILTRSFTDTTERVEAERLLLLLALFSPLPTRELAELSGAAIGKVTSLLERLGMVTDIIGSSRTSSISLFHTSIRSSILSHSVGFEAIDIARLQFGAEEAERDKALQVSFMPPPSVKSILTGDKSIVLGDRGSGKSAIFRAIRDPGLFQWSQSDLAASMPPHSAHVIPAEDPSAFISTVVESGASDTSAERFRAAWLLYVSALVSPRIRSHVKVPKDLYEDAWRMLRSVGWQGKDSASPGWLERFRHGAAETVFSKVNKVAFGPITIEPKFDGGGQSFARKPLDLAGYLDRCDDLFHGSGQPVLIIVDRIDEIAKYDRKQQERLVQGLMMAESYLAQKAALKLIILLRTDLFELYDVQEKNKFISRTVRLEWELNQLLQIMMRRLFANDQISKLATALRLQDSSKDAQDGVLLRIVFPDVLEGVPIRRWLTEQLANGKGRISPRQIVLLLLLAQEEAVKIGTERLCPLFDEGAVRKAMTRLSELSYGEVVSDYRLSTTFVKNCRAGKYREFTVKQVEPLFDLEDGSVAAQTELLERLGFLERVVVQTPNGPESRFRIPQLFTRCWETA